MTKIIAILFVLGQFQVAVETSTGYFVGTYPDTEIGVTQFQGDIRTALGAETGRFYSCIAYDGPNRDLLSSPLAEKIRLVERIQTGLRDPGIADPPWIVRQDRMRDFLEKHPKQKADAKLVEKICLSLLPPYYRQIYPAKSGMREFYRATE